MNGMFGGGMWFGWIFWIILIVVVIWAITQFVSKNQSVSSTSAGSGDSPLDILKKRYARGEISKDEFDEMRKDL